MTKSVKRIYVRKKDRFDYKSKEVKKEIENLLKIKVEKLNIYNRYDLQIRQLIMSYPKEILTMFMPKMRQKNLKILLSLPLQLNIFQVNLTKEGKGSLIP